MKIGVLINCYRLPLAEAIRKAAEAGADGVQFYANADLIDEPQKLTELKTIADDCGITISALVAELGGHGFQIAAENPAKLERMKAVFAAAGKLEDWVHAYLLSDGDNPAFSHGLKLFDRFFLGPGPIYGQGEHAHSPA